MEFHKRIEIYSLYLKSILTKPGNSQFNHDFEIFTKKTKNKLYGHPQRSEQQIKRKHQLIDTFLGKIKNMNTHCLGCHCSLDNNINYFNDDFSKAAN